MGADGFEKFAEFGFGGPILIVTQHTHASHKKAAVEACQPLDIYHRWLRQPSWFAEIDFASATSNLRGQRRHDRERAGIA